MASEGAPSAKEKKYDRQLRLWGADGQRHFEKANILLVNATVVGVETLKNLILPGIGKFIILDPAEVTPADLGNNFFLNESSIGAPRAKISCEMLKELNPDVTGAWVMDSLENVVFSRREVLQQFSLVILTPPVSMHAVSQLEKYLSHSSPKTAVVSVLAPGFFYSIRIARYQPHSVKDPHPESLVELQLLNPWKELSTNATMSTINLDAMSDVDHGHVPYVYLLLHYLSVWKQQHGKYPTEYAEKQEFKRLIASNNRGDDENFEEAVNAINAHIVVPQLPSNLKDLFNSEERILYMNKYVTVDGHTHPFWLASDKKPFYPNSLFWFVIVALLNFYRDKKVLPLTGTIPDMKSRSKDYGDLQSTYRRKSEQDKTTIHNLVETYIDEVRNYWNEIPRDKEHYLVSKFRDPETGRLKAKTKSKVDSYVKNAAYLQCFRYTPISGEGGKMLPATRKAIRVGLTQKDHAMAVHVALRTFEEYLSQQMAPKETEYDGYEAPVFPGADGNCLQADFDKLKGLSRNFLLDVFAGDETAVGDVIDDVESCLQEIIRSGGQELHNVASMAAGVAAQEATKLITSQYIPIDNTIVFDAISSNGATFKLDAA